MLIVVLCFFAIAAVASASIESTPPPKPQWPQVFDVPFGFTDRLFLPPYHNVSSHFWYNWDVKSQLIDYPKRCFPFESLVSSFYPCKLLFNPSGIYYHSKRRGVDCCQFVEGVGAVPPDFLRSFNYSDDQTVPDMSGEPVASHHWIGAAKFAYWTSIQAPGVTGGRDVQFKDGPTGIEWNFGSWAFSKQNNASMYQFPGDCSKKCSKLFGNKEVTQLERHPLIKLARMFSSTTEEQGDHLPKLSIVGSK